MRIKKLFFVLIAIALTITCAMPLATAFAGTSVSTIGDLSNKSQWSQADTNGTQWGATAIVFNTDTDEDATNIVNSSFAKKPDDGATNYAGISAKLIISEFSNSTGYFAFAFGLEDRKSSKIGEADTIEVYLKQGNTGINAGIRIINENGVATLKDDVVDAVPYGEEFSVEILINKDKLLTANIGTEALSTTLDAFPAERAGFGQNGVKTLATIKALSINKYEYQTPQNVDYIETFEPAEHPNGEVGYNSKVFYTQSAAGSRAPTHLEVRKDEVSGNSYLEFSNTGYAYVATKHQYSNFSFTCDIFNFQNDVTYDENGELLTLAQSKMWIAFGGANGYKNLAEHNMGVMGSIHIGWNGPMTSDDWTKWGNRNIMMNFVKSGIYNQNVASMGFNIFDNTLTDDGYQVPFKMHFKLVDGVVELWFAPISDYDAAIAAGTTPDDYWANYPHALYCDAGLTPTGYFLFGTNGGTSINADDPKKSTCGNFCVDNMEIKNLDANANLITNIGYAVNGWPQRGETYYDYNDFYNDNDLLANKLANGVDGGITATDLIVICVCAGIVVAVAAVAAVMLLKKKPASAEPIAEESDKVEE